MNNGFGGQQFQANAPQMTGASSHTQQQAPQSNLFGDALAAFANAYAGGFGAPPSSTPAPGPAATSIASGAVEGASGGATQQTNSSTVSDMTPGVGQLLSHVDPNKQIAPWAMPGQQMQQQQQPPGQQMASGGQHPWQQSEAQHMTQGMQPGPEPYFNPYAWS